MDKQKELIDKKIQRMKDLQDQARFGGGCKRIDPQHEKDLSYLYIRLD